MIKKIECYHLNFKYFRGQGYDVGSNISGKNGVQALRYLQKSEYGSICSLFQS